MGVDPLAHMLNLLASDTVTEMQPGPDGKLRKVQIPVTHAMRTDAAKTLLPHFYPRLNAQQVSGPEGAAVPVMTLDINQLLADPAALEAAQALSLAMTGQSKQPALIDPPNPDWKP
jgi:hypothetical protein